MNNDKIAVTEQEDEAFEAMKSVEWKPGDRCIYEGNGAIIVGWHPEHPVIVIDADEFGLIGVSMNELIKPETPEQKEERELVNDLHCEMSFEPGEASRLAKALLHLGYRKVVNND